MGGRLRPDDWLAKRLARPCLTLPVDTPIDAQLRSELARSPLFVTAKVPAVRLDIVGELESLRFRVIETSLLFTAHRGGWAPIEADVKFAQAEHRAGVRLIAETAFRYSRFHLDPLVPDETANRIKGDWAENFFLGQRGDGMVVAERDGRVAGFLQLVWAGATLMIDLIAVAPAFGRLGLARAMINFAWQYGTSDSRAPESIAAGTQAANIASCQLYESMGFRLSAATLVMHYHGGEAPA